MERVSIDENYSSLIDQAHSEDKIVPLDLNPVEDNEEDDNEQEEIIEFNNKKYDKKKYDAQIVMQSKLNEVQPENSTAKYVLPATIIEEFNNLP
jgi:hypothetical protein